MSQFSVTSIRNLVDQYFSLQWCRDNLVVPLGIEPSLPPSPGVITIAVGNIVFLGTIGNTIKERINQSGLECKFVERSPEKIKEILDLAAEERFISGEGIEISEFTEEAVIAALQDTATEGNDDDFSLEFDDIEEEELVDETEDLSNEMLESKTQRAAGMILINTCRSNVSDIHIEPKIDNYKIRVRRDGVMQKFLSMPKRAGIQLIACLKNMAHMDIAERRASQDGKILRQYEGNRMEFRCSTAPGKYGEGMVLRILNSDASVLNLDVLIHIEKVRNEFRKIINNTNGIVIVSGPTGSGKSTTLAAALREKDNGELKIVTAEDPIEYDLSGDIMQHQVNRAKNQTFANLLRTFLRQDPDVILIGETRDPETAESSMDAAETGHLVFTTLHANTSSSSLTRLLDMEVPKYKLNASVRGVLAQRLLRRVCPECSVQRPINNNESQITGIRPNTPIRYANVLSSEEKEQRKREGTLCGHCSGTGYKGRVGAYELLVINRPIQNAITSNKTDKEIEEMAVDNNEMLTLMKYGVELVKEQLTTLSELERVCKSDD
ncbi:GspE/PulE family protein [Prochlorococcus marinus]|uniref:Type II secretory pathway, ATPase PulE/Tfp pilus assembly pathway, ATPase PilB n=1 Tax=Prochlorococcus marinus (strain MIT 9211) TaxID=93059 RepID=A9BA93_PROM4|nr:GspE/PulE family protein [Prochlorococcus marinus]ABX08755.1 Type II secretory pathway, ATPase PulE/Tfp pilus assembly pathway, ATPase PilB [Prochlorococcus marinus str. MIT 9211]